MQTVPFGLVLLPAISTTGASEAVALHQLGDDIMKSWLAMGGLLAASSAFGQAQYGYPIPAKGFAVFGIMDLGVGRTSSAGGGSTKQTFETSGDYSSSRLGFRGTEDLGDGLSASFWLEAAVDPDTG